jgi:hypothetical protein
MRAMLSRLANLTVRQAQRAQDNIVTGAKTQTTRDIFVNHDAPRVNARKYPRNGSM